MTVLWGALLAVLAFSTACDVPDDAATLDSSFDGDDEGCAALSLLQRHAHQISQEDTGTLRKPSNGGAAVRHDDAQPDLVRVAKAPRASLAHAMAAVETSSAATFNTVRTAESAHHESGVVWRKQRRGLPEQAAKPKVSMPSHKASMLDSVGPVPLSLLGMHSQVTGEQEVRLSGGTTVLLIAIPAAVVILLIFLYCLVDARKASVKKAASPLGSTLGSTVGSKGEVTDAFLLSGATPGPGSAARIGTQSSISSTASWSAQRQSPTMPQRYSPLAPHLVPHQGREQSAILFPLEAATAGNSGTFPVHWSDMGNARFRLEVERGLLTSKETLRLYDVHNGGNTLMCSINLSVNVVTSAMSYVVDNSQLRARTNGLNMRTKKSMENDSRSSVRVVGWGQMVTGVDDGDGWLEVPEGLSTYYLPTQVNGHKTVVLAGNSSNDNSIHVLNAAGTSFASFQWCGQEGRSYKYGLFRNGAKIADVQIPGRQSGTLFEATSNGRTLAQVEGFSLGGTTPEKLELLVENVDPAMMLMGAVASLRRLPAHGR
jgi:hypothetical protein